MVLDFLLSMKSEVFIKSGKRDIRCLYIFLLSEPATAGKREIMRIQK